MNPPFGGWGTAPKKIDFMINPSVHSYPFYTASGKSQRKKIDFDIDYSVPIVK
jgi:hypothetical protein